MPIHRKIISGALKGIGSLLGIGQGGGKAGRQARRAAKRARRASRRSGVPAPPPTRAVGQRPRDPRPYERTRDPRPSDRRRDIRIDDREQRRDIRTQAFSLRKLGTRFFADPASISGPLAANLVSDVIQGGFGGGAGQGPTTTVKAGIPAWLMPVGIVVGIFLLLKALKIF